MSAALPHNSGAGRQITLSPKNLRVHEALREIAGLEPTSITGSPVTDLDTVLVTHMGEILAGVQAWQSALRDGREEISCVRYDCDAEQALWIILSQHQTRRGWNAFVRIGIALKLEPYFQERAQDNMRAGGKYKGSANLPKADRIDVREEIARAAGVGIRNVSKAKEILRNAHDSVLHALRVGTLTIHRAHGFCKLPKSVQVEKLNRYSTQKINNKVIQHYVLNNATTDVCSVLELIRQQASNQPGSVVVRLGNADRTVLQLAADLLTEAHPVCEIEQL
jgi:hypothetical protein